MLISSARLELSIKLDISAQTGLRPIETCGEKGLQVKDIRPDQNTITARITKGCNARPPLPITKELTARIQTLIAKQNLKPDDLLFSLIQFAKSRSLALRAPTTKTQDNNYSAFIIARVWQEANT
jgi:hypothetical protein